MKIKGSVSLALASLLVFSNSAMAATVSKPVLKSETVKPQRDFAKSITFKNGQNLEKEAGYKKSDKVRVIVEVEGEPAITYATKQGKKYNELSASVKEKLQKDILKEQNAVKSKIAAKAVKMQFKQNFTTAVNGFSGIVEYGQVAALRKVDGVTKVTIANEYQRPKTDPEMKYSKEIVQAQATWDDYGVKGEGMVVAVVDTGIDPSHKDMVLTDASKADLTKAEIETVVKNKGVLGQYFTEKVPYGYNYYDENNEILDIGPDASMHGMHVAGTVGANGNEAEGGLKGVAPEAQLLAMKVFGNDPEMPSTWSDIIIKAIDDAIQLDADVVNMSLGSTGAFVLPDDPEQMAVQRGIDNGVLMSISAGNSNHFGDGYFNPLAANPDKGVVGSPGLSTNSLQVASLENSFIDMFAATYSFGETVGKAPFMSASSVDPNQQAQKSFEVLDAGIGQPSDFAGKDFTGKYALVQRGTLTFVDKTLNAQAAGAAGIIIYNNVDGYISMATSADIKIPQLAMLKTDGLLLKAQIDSGTPVTIEFKGDKVTANNPTANQMSSFTSWGVTPNLDFKPEITAPGGNILSTLNNNQYGTMSGTSMAAPHVAGGSALVLERVEKDFPSLTGAAKVNMAKNILMNTSKVVEDKGTYNAAYMHNPYSPRRQGAGLMQLHSALSTPVVVTNAKTNEAKVALKEIKDNKATFTLKAENFSDKAVTYNVSGNVLTDLNINGVDQLESQGIYKAGTISEAAPWVGEFPISFSTEQLTIQPKGSATVEVTVDLTDTVEWGYNAPLEDLFENGYFVEGFVTLTDVNDENPIVNVPYVGFNGDWNKAPIMDTSRYDENFEEKYFYGYTGMVTSAGDNNYNYLGYNPTEDSFKAENIAFSPTGDGVSDDAMPILSFLRNAKSVEYKIVDKDGNVLRKLNSEELVRKNFNDGNRGAQYYIKTAAAWDGKVKNKLVADGEYFYEISSTIDFEGKEPQKVTFPVKVDTVAPKVTASVKGDKLTLSGTDEKGSGVAYYDILVNGKSVFGEKDLPLAGTATEYTFAKAPVGGTVEVVAYDFAGNTTKAVVEGANDSTIPFIHVTSIGATNTYTSHELPVAGYLTDDSKVTDFAVNGKSVELVWNDETSRYEFSTTVTFEEDGVQEVRISGKDAAGNAINYLVRDLVVDTTAPELKVDVPSKVKSNVDKVTLTAVISDNFEELQYKVDGNEEFNHQFQFENFVMNSIEKTITTELTLEPGNNTFTLELEDVAGNKTTKEVSIYRGDTQVDRIAGLTRYATSAAVSQKGWEKSDVVVLARGDEYADALAGVPLAAKYDAPLLLTNYNYLNAETKEEIARLGAKKVYILGGDVAILPAVEKQIKDSGVEVVRLSGTTRYDTAAAIAKEVAPNGSDKVVVVNGENYPDALSVASYAGAEGLPILLANSSKSLPAATKKAIDSLGSKETLVIGGKEVITDGVASTLPKVTRLSGTTRFDTNIAVAKHFGTASNVVYVATGYNFPDSLAGAALAAKDKAGIVLVSTNLPEAAKAYLASLEITQVNVFGGEEVVSPSVISEISDLLK
ncbi:cell wall-binding repeat-containing protein [Neobacillus niacini]|uniref:cell wall-binding repeat-containing protein n=1 Tax=Neobacillus niacini TaxID=86668 RepID=UPI00203C5831|nr:cell wall-binding repeat-containing protein [Neobacillus niacini]MCM3691629.1 S8 family serine peptidase [Neobacillus niacini]